MKVQPTNRPADRRIATVIIALIAVAFGWSFFFHDNATPKVSSEYVLTLDAGHDERMTKLTADYGYLSIVGRYRLIEGKNLFGGPETSAGILLPETRLLCAGELRLNDGEVTLVAEPMSLITIDNEVVVTLKEVPLQIQDGDIEPDLLFCDDIQFYVMKVGVDYYVRVKDPSNPLRTEFKTIERFPANIDLLVEGTFEPNVDGDRAVPTKHVANGQYDLSSPGRVVFDYGGDGYSLTVFGSTDRLWTLFADESEGTYGWRELMIGPVTDGRVVIDFNRAENLPCAYNYEGTFCPFPPRENSLPFAVSAGEKFSHDEWSSVGSG